MKYTIVSESNEDDKKQIQITETQEKTVGTTTIRNLKEQLLKVEDDILHLVAEKQKIENHLSGIKKSLKLKVF